MSLGDNSFAIALHAPEPRDIACGTTCHDSLATSDSLTAAAAVRGTQ
jgi:hypothetical protein